MIGGRTRKIRGSWESSWSAILTLPAQIERPTDPWGSNEWDLDDLPLSRDRLLRPWRGKANRLGQQDGLDPSQRVQRRFGHVAVHLHHGNGRRFRTAPQREVGDVDVVLTEHSSDTSDHAGHIEVAQVNHVALKRSLDMNAVDLQQARLAAVLHTAGHRILVLRAFEGHAKRAGR